MNAFHQKDLWRAIYIRLLEMPIVELRLVRDRFELEAIDDLIDAKFIRGKVERDTAGIPAFPVIRGITLAGRIFAEDQREYLAKKTLIGRIKTVAVVVAAWVLGVFTPEILRHLF